MWKGLKNLFKLNWYGVTGQISTKIQLNTSKKYRFKATILYLFKINLWRFTDMFHIILWILMSLLHWNNIKYQNLISYQKNSQYFRVAIYCWGDLLFLTNKKNISHILQYSFKFINISIKFKQFRVTETWIYSNYMNKCILIQYMNVFLEK